MITARFGRRFTAAVYGVLGVIVLLPVLSVRVPVLGDYVNHLARIHILTTIRRSAALQQFYQDNWHFVPYFGMDLPVGGLSHIVDIYDAGRIFVALCVLMPVVAAATLRYAVHGRIGLMPALAFLISYNYLLALGFLSYLFSACLAIMLFAGWIAAGDWPRWRRAAAFLLPAAALYAMHVFAFAAYGIMVIGYELARAARPKRRRWATIAADFAAAGLQAVVPAILAVLFRAADTFGTAHITRYGSVSDRISAFLSPVYFPGGSAALVGAFVLAPVLGLLLARGMRVASALSPPLLAVTLAALAAPAILLNIWGIAFRLPFVVAIVLIAAVSPRRLNRPAACAVLASLAALIGIRAWTATALLHKLDAQVGQIRQVVAQLPIGARLLIVDGPQNAPGRLAPLATIQHMGLVATIDRDAFVPMLFTGTTPLQLLPKMRDAASPGGGIGAVTLAQLRDGFARASPPGELPIYRDGARVYWLGWPRKYDDVLITHFGGDIGSLPPVLHRVAGNDVADLYGISTPAAVP
jgi:hypothetical protein